MATSEIINKIMDRLKDPYQKMCKYEYCDKKEFTAKRLNQEYCCANHKMKANNLKAKEKRDATKKINSILIRNREILKDFYNRNKVNVTLNELQDLGFEYDFHTHRKKETKLNIMVPLYYEFGLIKDNEQSLSFIKIWKVS